MKNSCEHAPNALIKGAVVQEMVTGGIEMIVGVSHNDPFGMAVVVGSGGVLVELLRDSALTLAPVSKTRALELIEQTRSNQLLDGYRGEEPSDKDALVGLLTTLSDLALLYEDVLDAIDLNPVYVGAQGRGLKVVDALIVPRNS